MAKQGVIKRKAGAQKRDIKKTDLLAALANELELGSIEEARELVNGFESVYNNIYEFYGEVPFFNLGTLKVKSVKAKRKRLPNGTFVDVESSQTSTFTTSKISRELAKANYERNSSEG